MRDCGIIFWLNWSFVTAFIKCTREHFKEVYIITPLINVWFEDAVIVFQILYLAAKFNSYLTSITCRPSDILASMCSLKDSTNVLLSEDFLMMLIWQHLCLDLPLLMSSLSFPNADLFICRFCSLILLAPAAADSSSNFFLIHAIYLIHVA